MRVWFGLYHNFSTILGCSFWSKAFVFTFKVEKVRFFKGKFVLVVKPKERVKKYSPKIDALCMFCRFLKAWRNPWRKNNVARKVRIAFCLFSQSKHTGYFLLLQKSEMKLLPFAIFGACWIICHGGIQRGFPWVWVVSCILTKEIHCASMLYQEQFVPKCFLRHLSSNTQIAEKPRFETVDWWHFGLYDWWHYLWVTESDLKMDQMSPFGSCPKNALK